MGKSCIRWRRGAVLPLALVGALAAKWTLAQRVKRYERQRRARSG